MNEDVFGKPAFEPSDEDALAQRPGTFELLGRTDPDRRLHHAIDGLEHLASPVAGSTQRVEVPVDAVRVTGEAMREVGVHVPVRELPFEQRCHHRNQLREPIRIAHVERVGRGVGTEDPVGDPELRSGYEFQEELQVAEAIKAYFKPLVNRVPRCYSPHHKKLSGSSSVVERFLAKEKVAGSIPVYRSTKNSQVAGGFSFQRKLDTLRLANIYLIL